MCITVGITLLFSFTQDYCVATAVPKAGNKYPPDWERRRKRVYQRDDYECQHCGALGGSRGDTELHAHHILPISSGGTHELSNLTTLCWSCHNDQHDHHIKRTDPSADPGGWIDGSPPNTETFIDKVGNVVSSDTDDNTEKMVDDWDSTQWRVFLPIYLLGCVLMYSGWAPWLGAVTFVTALIGDRTYAYKYK